MSSKKGTISIGIAVHLPTIDFRGHVSFRGNQFFPKTTFVRFFSLTMSFCLGMETNHQPTKKTYTQGLSKPLDPSGKSCKYFRQKHRGFEIKNWTHRIYDFFLMKRCNQPTNQRPHRKKHLTVDPKKKSTNIYSPLGTSRGWTWPGACGDLPYMVDFSLPNCMGFIFNHSKDPLLLMVHKSYAN